MSAPDRNEPVTTTRRPSGYVRDSGPLLSRTASLVCGVLAMVLVAATGTALVATAGRDTEFPADRDFVAIEEVPEREPGRGVSDGLCRRVLPE